MIWFNPPFNLKTKTKIGKLFLNLLDKRFPPHDKLHRLFNRTNVKISYSYMPNINSYTYVHNHKVLNDKPNETVINNCNCQNKDTCPLANSCQTKYIIYQANIDCDIAGYKQKSYLGSCETTFKDRFGNHKKSFNHVKQKKMIRNYQKNFGKSKSTMEHQKLPGKLSKCVVLTIQTVRAASYV